jgi:hypothetical protein
MSDGLVRLSMLLVLPLMLVGCAAGRPSTLVESLTDPGDFKFVTVVPQRGKGPGGWRAACIPLRLKRDTGEVFVCKFGVEMPIENGKGPISTPLAMRVSADCANLAAEAAFSDATPATPLGIACEEFKAMYEVILSSAIEGAHVVKKCNERAERAMVPRVGR